MLRRRTSGSVVCPSCGALVGVNDERCYTCGRANPGLWGFGPALRQLGSDLGFVPLVLGASAVLYLLTLLASGRNLQIMGGGFNILAPSAPALLAFGASGGYPVFQMGSWWTVLSATWLHGSFLHILFNMMWVRQIGPAVADIYGAGRMVIIYTISSAMGFLLSSFMGAYLPGIPFIGGGGLTIGASAPIFGLLGALVYYGRRGGSSMVRSEALGYAVTLFVMGLFLRGVDNAAHAGGFIGGYVAGMWLDPLKQERVDHLVGAVICLAVTAIAIVVSIVTMVW